MATPAPRCSNCGRTLAEHARAERRDPYTCPCCHDTKSASQPWCAACRCPVANGTYACSLAKSHDGLHFVVQGKRRYRFADKYSAVVPA